MLGSHIAVQVPWRLLTIVGIMCKYSLRLWHE